MGQALPMKHISPSTGIAGCLELLKMVDDYSASHSSATGTIGHNSKVFNCSNIRNVRFGPFSHVEGTMTLNKDRLTAVRLILFLSDPE